MQILTRFDSDSQKLLQEEYLDENLPARIREKNLYFRVSVVGACNLSCPFCHNEGAPTKGRLPFELFERATVVASKIGFTRLQLTGGEPLLHPEIGQFITIGKNAFQDVGITTNGTHLDSKIKMLIECGITRIHVSLQTTPLIDAGTNGDYGIPKWLISALNYSKSGEFDLRLNMPVPFDQFEKSENFLNMIAEYGCDVKVFSILPKQGREDFYPIEELENLVSRSNEYRLKAGKIGEVFLRGYHPPQGIRCRTCVSIDKCREQSHSLRLGADGILRPCLASREWDVRVNLNMIDDQIRNATILALDF